jgi:hypothetical protein
MKQRYDIKLIFHFQHAAFYIYSWIIVHMIPGEGELKLINWINEFIVKEKPSRGDGRIVVCGGDSDLILQCMLSGVAHRLHICQECRGQKRFEGFRYLLWDVNKLVHLIINSTCSGSNETASSDRSADAQPAFPLFRRDRRTDPVRSSVPASSLVSPILFDNAARAEAAESVVGLGQRLDISMLFIFQGMHCLYLFIHAYT